MKRPIIIILLSVVLFASVAFAQQVPTEWQWRLRALSAELGLAQQRLNDAREAVQEFIRELDSKGYMLDNGRIVKKPVPAPEEPKK